MMKKLDKKLVATTALAGTMMVGAQAVHADTVSDTTTLAPTSETTTQKAPATDVTTAKQDVKDAQGEVNQAQTEADKTQVAQDQAQKATDQAQKDVDQAQAKTDVAQKAKDEATPEKIAETETAIKNQENTVKQLQDNVTNKQNDLDQKNQALNQARTDVDQAKQNLDQAQSEKDQADQAVKDAQAVVDGTHADEIRQNAKDTADQVVKDKQAVQDATATNAKAQQDMLNAKDAQASAQETADTKQATADKTQATLDQANKDVKDAQGKVDTINDKLNSINHITLPDNYGELTKKNTKIQEGYDLNHFKHSKTDQTVKVDPYHLTTEQQKELTLWITDLLNPLHDKLGATKFTVTADSLNFAKVVADNYWNVDDHDEAAIKKGEDSVGGTYFTGEALGALGVGSYTFNPSQKEFNLDQIKEAIWNNIMMMLFDDSHSGWGHASLLLGTASSSMAGNSAPSYLGFAIDQYSGLHFLNYVPDNNDHSEVFTSPNSEETLRQELATATQDLTAKQEVASDAKTANDQAQSELQDAKNTLNTATQDLTAKQAKANKTQQALSDASDKLAKDQEAAQKAQALLDQLNQDLPTKLANLQKAKDNQTAKNQAFDQAYNNWLQKSAAVSSASQDAQNAQKALAQAQQKVKDAQTKLDNLKQELNNLQNADANLAAAKADLLKAQTALAQAKLALADAKDANDQAQANLATKQLALKEAQATLKTLQDRERAQAMANQAQAQIKQDQANQAHKHVYYQVNGQLLDANGKPVSGITVKNGLAYNKHGEVIGTVAQVSAQAVRSMNNEMGNKAVLPQLSDNDQDLAPAGVGMALLGGILGMFGLAVRRKRN